MAVRYFLGLFLLVITLIPQTLHAEDSSGLIEWHSTNIQLLKGSGYELAPRSQTVVTFEHVHGWTYGDNFVFVDYSIGHPDLVASEFSPRLSFSKITGQEFQLGPITDVLLSGTWEVGRRFDAYLYGVGVDLDIPGFNFVQLNAYERNNPDADGKGWQVTGVWNKPFSLGELDAVFEGYFDLARYEENDADLNFYTQPQFLIDVGKIWDQPGHTYAGLEYLYWHNKFGIDGVTEQAPQALIKHVF